MPFNMNVGLDGPVSLAGTLIQQTNGQSLDPRLVEEVSSGGGNEALLSATMRQNPSASFETPALETLLGVVDMYPVQLATVDLYSLLGADAANGVSAGANHTKMRLQDVHTILRRLRADDTGVASASVDMIGVYDGTNNPLTVTQSEALPSFAGNKEMYTLGPVYLGTTLYPAQSVELDTGITDEQQGHSGEAYNRASFVTQIAPVVTFSSLDATLLTDALLLGAEHKVTFFLRKLQDNSSIYSDASLEHIKVELLLTKVSAQVDNNDKTMINYRCQGVKSGVNDICTITTGVAIVAPV